MKVNVGFVTARGINYRNEIRTIRKKTDMPLQPIYEAFMNSWEAIMDKFTSEHMDLGIINIHLYKNPNLFSSETGQADFDKVVVEDNGLGLDDKSYKRLEDLRDDSKNHSNLGTGRIQFIHFFENTKIESVYRANTGNRKKCIRLSKSEAFLMSNAIMSLDYDEESEEVDTGTIVTFTHPLDEKDKNFYIGLNIDELKKETIRHFLSLLCENRDNLPQIHIKISVNNKVCEQGVIFSSDIPTPDKEDDKLELSYSKLNEKNRIVDAERNARFHLKAFKRPSCEIKQNAIYLVSKGATGTSIELECLQKNEEISGNRYMFLLSSPAGWR